MNNNNNIITNNQDLSGMFGSSVSLGESSSSNLIDKPQAMPASLNQNQIPAPSQPSPPTPLGQKIPPPQYPIYSPQSPQVVQNQSAIGVPFQSQGNIYAPQVQPVGVQYPSSIQPNAINAPLLSGGVNDKIGFDIIELLFSVKFLRKLTRASFSLVLLFLSFPEKDWVKDFLVFNSSCKCSIKNLKNSLES